MLDHKRNNPIVWRYLLYITIYSLIAFGGYAFYQYEMRGCLFGCEQALQIEEPIAVKPLGSLANSDSPTLYHDNSNDIKKNELNNNLRLAHNYLDFYRLKGDLSNRERAKQYFKKVAKMGNAEAQYYSGLLYEEDNQIDDAMVCYISASNQHMIEATYHLGRIYLNDYFHRDYKKASKYLRLAVDEYYYPAYEDLASLYASGRGVQQNPKKAIELYKALLKNGYYYSGYYLEIASLSVAIKDYGDALRFYYRAVESDELTALYQLGNFYYHILSKQETLDEKQQLSFYKKAYLYYQQALAKGDQRANLPLAKLYLNGNGVNIDYELARYHFTKALRERETQVDALVELAFIYRLGIGVDPDVTRAIQYIETAVSFNDPQAAYILGTYYLFGYGHLSKDIVKAKPYFDLALKLGDKQLKREIEEIMEHYY